MGKRKPVNSLPDMLKRAQTAADASWHFDKRVPIAIILALGMQTGGMVWWAASAAERLNAATERLSTLERKVEAAAPQAERLARVETKLESVRDGILEIKSILRPAVPVGAR